MTIPLWNDPEWLEQAHEWIRARVVPTGPIEQPHVRPWSTVLRVPTSGGDVWLKATMASVGHEPALLDALARWGVDCVPRPLAVDLERRWMLLPDGGPILRGVQTLERWEEVLPLYVELQRETAPHADELVALGVPDHRLAVLPTRAGDLAPRVAALCEELAAFGVPETLQHDDLHSSNVFVGAGGYTFFDWGDSCVSHPFFTMVVMLRSTAYHFELDEDGPETRRLLDVYLDAWGGGDELRAAFEPARRLGILCRALTWRRIVLDLPSPWSDQFEERATGWLDDFRESLRSPP